jgi:hypothetical protein
LLFLTLREHKHIEKLRYMRRKSGEAQAGKISGVVGLEQFLSLLLGEAGPIKIGS